MKLLVLLTQIGFGVLLVGGWELATHSGVIDPQLLPPPSTVLLTLGDLMGNVAFLNECSDTVVRVLAAFIIGAPIALAVVFMMARNSWSATPLHPPSNPSLTL